MIEGFQIRALSFHGIGKDPAVVKFGPGLNVIYGASNTGKSFVIEAIDFMLGGKGPLTDIPERIGYDRVLLAVENITNGDSFTLLRSHEGGPFKVFEGSFTDELPTVEGITLSDVHNAKNQENLSFWLLNQLDMPNVRVRKNKHNDTISLSFRHLARLAIVNEEEIIQRRSPLADGNYTADTANASVFKYLLTGADDSALVSLSKRTPEEMSREGQIELLDELVKSYRKQVKAIAGQPAELENQDQRLGEALEQKAEQLNLVEGKYKALSAQKRNFYKKIEEADNRLTEVSILLERFSLLAKHYNSDLQRLKSIEEAGSLFIALGGGDCPVCGALPGDHRSGDGCEGDIERTIAAASAEVAKIENRQADLTSTILTLEKEEKTLQKRLPKAKLSLTQVLSDIREIIAPDLKRQRASYAELSNKRVGVREAITLYETLSDLEMRKAKLISEDMKTTSGSNVGSDLPSTIVNEFTDLIASILTEWQFPNVGSVYFDTKSKDLVIGGKKRTAFGKGLRAITQAAFSIGLLRYCKEFAGRHPGFVALDSPLLSYKEPDNEEDDLKDSGLKEAFYRDLQKMQQDRQLIIIENVPPTPEIIQSEQATEFTGSKTIGRFGLFPVS
ncbi:AAA family ATPase [Pseudovibrio denitrificans]|uniref:AAA family ATPase n=1 Tax=Pseudovibrio denitrificans TaxID=258256 RepID=UPI0039BF1220